MTCTFTFRYSSVYIRLSLLVQLWHVKCNTWLYLLPTWNLMLMDIYNRHKHTNNFISFILLIFIICTNVILGICVNNLTYSHIKLKFAKCVQGQWDLCDHGLNNLKINFWIHTKSYKKIVKTVKERSNFNAKPHSEVPANFAWIDLLFI